MVYVVENLKSSKHLTDFYENWYNNRAITGHPQLIRLLPTIKSKNMVYERPCKAEEALELCIFRG